MTDPDTESSHKVYDADSDVANQERGGVKRSDFDSTFRDIANQPTIADEDRNTASNDAVKQEQASLDNSQGLAEGSTPANATEHAEKDATEANDDPNSLDDPNKGLFTGSIQGKKARGILGRLPFKKRVAIASAAVAFTTILGLTAGSMLPSVGAFHMIHANQILSTLNEANAHTKDLSVVEFYRYMRKGELAKTRLSMLQYLNHDKLVAKLKLRGISIYAGNVGQPNKVYFEDVGKSLPELAGKSPTEVAEILSKEHGLDPKSVKAYSAGMYDSSPVSVRVDLSNEKPAVQKSLLRQVSKSLKLGERASLMPYHHLKTYQGISDLLHPFRSTRTAGEAKIATKINSWMPSKPKIDERRAALKARFEAFRGKYSGQLRGAGLAMLTASILCAMRDAAVEALEIQESGIVDIGVAMTAQMMSGSEQVALDRDIEADAIDTYVKGTYDEKGRWLADSKEWARLTGQPEPAYDEETAVRTDLYRNAFSSDNPLKKFVAAADYIQVGGVGLEELCSPASIAVQTIIGIGLIVISIPVSGGVGGAAAYLLMQGAIAGGSALLMGAAMSAIMPMLVGVIPSNIDLAGAAGGDLAVMSAGRIFESTAIGGGANIMNANDSKELSTLMSADKAKYSREQSLYARTLDPYNARSLVGMALDKTSPSVFGNFSRATDSFTSITSTIARIPTTLFGKKAYAANDTAIVSAYDALKSMTDMNTNDKEVQAIYDNDTLGYYTNQTGGKIVLCTGNIIDKKTDPQFGEYWDLTNVREVNKDSIEYQSECNIPEVKNDINMKKIRASIFMTQTAEAESCANAGDDAACAKLNVGSTGAAYTTATPGATAFGEAVGEATLPRAQGSWGGWTNGKLGGNGEEDYKKVLVPISSVGLTGCSGTISVPYLHPNVAAAAKVLNEEYSKRFGYGLIFESCYRTYTQQQTAWNTYQSGGNLAARPGTSNHGWGLAIDVAMTRYGGFSSPNYKWLAENAPKYGFRTGVVASEAWHIEYARPVSGTSGAGSGGGGSTSW